MILKFLTGKATKQSRSSRNGSCSGGFSCWPEEVQYILRKYDITAVIHAEITSLRGNRQLINETELELASWINDTTYRCGNVKDELEKVKLFVDGFSPKT